MGVSADRWVRQTDGSDRQTGQTDRSDRQTDVQTDRSAQQPGPCGRVPLTPPAVTSLTPGP